MTNELVRIGVWQTLFVGIGLKKWLSNQDGVVCQWVATKNPLQVMESNPVDVLVAYRGNNDLGNFLRIIEKSSSRPRVAISASSALNEEEVIYLRDLGVESFIHLPSNETEAVEFLRALKTIAAGKSLVDHRVVSRIVARELRRLKAHRAGSTATRELYLGAQYSLV